MYLVNQCVLKCSNLLCVKERKRERGKGYENAKVDNECVGKGYQKIRENGLEIFYK